MPVRPPRPSPSPARRDPVAAQVMAAVRARGAGRGCRGSRGGQVRLGTLRPARATGRGPGRGGSGAVPAGGPLDGAGGGSRGVSADVRPGLPADGRGAVLWLHVAAGPFGLRAGCRAGSGGPRNVPPAPTG